MVLGRMGYSRKLSPNASQFSNSCDKVHPSVVECEKKEEHVMSFS